jgi:hypothetical protein
LYRRRDLADDPAAIRVHRRELLDVVAGPQFDDRGLIGRTVLTEQLGDALQVLLVAGRRDQEVISVQAAGIMGVR